MNLPAESLIKWGGIESDPDGRLMPMELALRKHEYDIVGAKVLDLGSNAGHFPLVYSSIGASRVTAVEPREVFAQFFFDELYTFKEAAKIRWNVLDVRNYQATPHDVLSCLGLIYHVQNGWEHLDRLVKQSGAKIMFFDSMFFDSMLWPKAGLGIETSRRNTNCARIIEIVPHPSKDDVEEKFAERGWKFKLLLENWQTNKKGLRGFWRVELC